MKKLSMILTFLVIFGSSAIGHTSDECVVFEGTFEMSTRRPVAQFESFKALDGEAILKVFDESKGHHAKKVISANISINGKKVIGSRDFFKKKYFRFWHHGKKKFFHYSKFKQPDDVIEKTVELTKGKNSLKVILNSMRGGKIKVAIVKPKYLASDDLDCDFIADDGDDNCPNDYNPDQADSDGDGIGDVCDEPDGYPNIVTATVDVGRGPYGGIAVSPDGEFVYVSNYTEGSVSVIKTADKTVSNTITVGKGPIGVSVTPDGAFVYVSNYSSNTVSVIDTSNHTLIDTIQVGSRPWGVSMTPDGTYAYVSNSSSNTVSVIDTSNHAVIETISVETSPRKVSMPNDGAYAYVNNYSSGSVSVIDTSNHAVIDTIRVGGALSDVSVTPDGKYAYVNNYTSGMASVIDVSERTVIDTITVGNGPDGISMTPNGAYAYVNNYLDDTVSVIQTSDHSVLATIEVGNEPRGGIAVSPDGKSVYVANYLDNNVSIIGLEF